MNRVNVIGVAINTISWQDALDLTLKWAKERVGRYICICNVHSVVTARQDQRFYNVLKEADLCTPDGAPVAWAIGQYSGNQQSRINGPDLFWSFCQRAAAEKVSIYLYGGREEVLHDLIRRIGIEFPGLIIAGYYSPPFRVLTDEEDLKLVERINGSGAGVVWVSLGCPKQEIWMAEHRSKIKALMIGVGAAFDYHSGHIKRAPLWMQTSGLEWFFRLCAEPRRLWRRYLITNSLYVWYLARQTFQR